MENERVPAEDELAGMTWWNDLDEYERRRWMKLGGNTGRVADAWNEWKRCVPTFLDDDGPVDPPTRLTKPRQ